MPFRDTLLAMLMHRKFNVSVLTTREVVGKKTPSKHETSYGVQYRNLCIVGPDAKYNTEHTFAEGADEQLRGHYEFLQCRVFFWLQPPSQTSPHQNAQNCRL